MNFLNIKNQTEDKADIYIYGDIVDDSWNWGWEDDPSVYPKNIRELLKECEGKSIDVHINSGGGHVFAGMAISNMIAHHDGKTTAIIDGLAGSIASVIAMGCDEIQMPCNAYLMIHKPS
ncbi:Clp protease ClpP, partial [Filifactor alocis]